MFGPNSKVLVHEEVYIGLQACKEANQVKIAHRFEVCDWLQRNGYHIAYYWACKEENTNAFATGARVGFEAAPISNKGLTFGL
jgi:hypothetical protein